MHSVRTLWREPAYLFLVFAIPAIAAYDVVFVDPINFKGYWISTFANASIFLIFSCPLGSASAALVAARARRAGVWSRPLVRSRASITFRLLLPSFVAALVAQLFGLVLLMSESWGAPGRIPFEIALTWVAIIAFHISIGYLLGRFLPVVASIPLAIFISYCWLGFTWTVDYFPVRYLSGLVIAACCSVETTLDERSVIAVVVFSSLMSVALLLLATVLPAAAHWSAAPIRTVVAVSIAVVATVIGLNVAQGLPAQPVTPRGQTELACIGEVPKVCVYPEQLQGKDPRPTLASAYENLRREGISLPPVITASNTKADRGSLRVVISTHPTTNQLVYSLSAALIPDDVAPNCGDGSDYPKRLDVAAVVIWWLQSVAGKGLLDTSSIGSSSLSPNSEALIKAFSRLGAEEQRDWYFAASPTLLHCKAAPLDIPTR